MSRTKKYNKDEKLKLINQLREKDSIIKELTKQLKNLNKEFNIKDEAEDTKPPVKPVATKKVKPSCANCKVGQPKVTDIGVRTIITCSDCDHREVIKNGTKNS